MANPISVPSTPVSTSSNHIPYRVERTRDNPKKLRRRRKPEVSPSRFLTPSSTVLSLLATIASSTVVDGSPTPPPFLCPAFANNSTPTRRQNRRDTISSADPSPVPNPIYRRSVVRTIPDKFEQGGDGIWRRVDSYTLYGICPNCATNTVSAMDDQIQVSSQNATATQSNMPDNFPPGWKPVVKPDSQGRTTLILAMSLVLAFLICFLIIGCLFWRKSLRRKIKDQDLEMKVKLRRQSSGLSTEEAREAMTEKENKSKQQIWARATARWKANARYSARQRRGKRFSRSIHARQSSISLENSHEGLTSNKSSPLESLAVPRISSRRPSTASLRQERSFHNSIGTTSMDTPEIPTISLPPAPQPHTSPPAYHREVQHPLTQSSAEALFLKDGSLSSYSPSSESRQPPHPPALWSGHTHDSGDMSFPFATVVHVATDDKSVLARLAELASAPPVEDQPQSTQPVISAPEWQDEPEDFAAQTTLSDDLLSQVAQSTSSLFPPPPSKGKMAAPNFYDYPYTFEEMSSFEAEIGPSAPPFEETSNTPFADDYDIPLTPSAPPLMEDGDFYIPDPVISTSESGAVSNHSIDDTQNQDGEDSDEIPPQIENLSVPIGEGTLPDYRP